MATTKYYIKYFAVYSILMKVGIKCEIHDCTIAIVELLEEQGIVPKNTSYELEEDKELRIDNQYYLKNKSVKIDFDDLSEFLLSIRGALNALSNEKIRNVRKAIDAQ